MSKFELRRLNHHTGLYDTLAEAESLQEINRVWDEQYPHSHHVRIYENYSDGRWRLVDGTTEDFDSRCYPCKKAWQKFWESGEETASE